jgi:ribosome-associated translation inhibitor RaiA
MNTTLQLRLQSPNDDIPLGENEAFLQGVAWMGKRTASASSELTNAFSSLMAELACKVSTKVKTHAEVDAYGNRHRDAGNLLLTDVKRAIENVTQRLEKRLGKYQAMIELATAHANGDSESFGRSSTSD